MIAKMILRDRERADGEEPEESILGDYTFIQLPAVGEIVTATVEDDVVNMIVRVVRHFPIPHPFVPNPDWPTLGRNEASVHLIVEWSGMA